MWVYRLLHRFEGSLHREATVVTRQAIPVGEERAFWNDAKHALPGWERTYTRNPVYIHRGQEPSGHGNFIIEVTQVQHDSDLPPAYLDLRRSF